MKYYKVRFSLSSVPGGATVNPDVLQTAKDLLCACVADAGFEAFEDDGTDMVGYVQKTLFDKVALDAGVGAFPIEGINISYGIGDAEDKNWNKTWEETGFEPIVITGKCVIHDTVNMPDECQHGEIDITIDTRQAFGTGNHETTYMIISELFDCELAGKNVVDCGCGTGILSIVSAKLGANCVMGYDIDEWSVANTKHNCALNDVNNVTVVQGDSSVLDNCVDKYDYVLANINRNILLQDIRSFRRAMSADATIILSGFYGQDARMLIEAAEGLGLKLVKSTIKNDWCMLRFVSGV